MVMVLLGGGGVEVKVWILTLFQVLKWEKKRVLFKIIAVLFLSLIVSKIFEKFIELESHLSSFISLVAFQDWFHFFFKMDCKNNGSSIYVILSRWPDKEILLFWAMKKILKLSQTGLQISWNFMKYSSFINNIKEMCCRLGFRGTRFTWMILPFFFSKRTKEKCASKVIKTDVKLRSRLQS